MRASRATSFQKTKDRQKRRSNFVSKVLLVMWSYSNALKFKTEAKNSL
jgi:hypothetical protein